MAFESLGEKLQGVFKKLKGQGKISEKDLKTALREVRVALLEADVNYKVVKDFINNVNERALGQEVLESLTPGQQVIKIVNDELTKLMGGFQSKLEISSKPPTIIMMVGLQGSGKTTSAGKLGRLLKKQGRRPLLVACDIYRPAAIKQLQVLGEQLDIPVFSMGNKTSPVDIARAAINHAAYHGNDIVILDTAGRLHIDEALMEELSLIKKQVNPIEILLVVDAMTGQDAVNVAEKFNELLDLTGVVLTKLDGDTRGGAALSVKAVTGKPVKFVGMGEKLDALEPFHPDRMASRILGMGDVLTLIEKAQENFDAKKSQELQQKLLKAEFTLEDFLTQMQQMKNMGPLDQIMDMLPGMNKAKLKGLQLDEKEFVRFQAIIQSMTKDERKNPQKINGSRRKRIAAGSGTRVQDVNRLLKQFEQAQKMMKQISGMTTGKGKKGKFKLPFM
ncbi:MAG: signal recognition particle subunit [Clostridia bacterium]|nr:signal recognition particle subunit [Clostridia bacterium]MDN5322749.1 signal recognition particle subunit [Clostridia bacterium]